jgi:UDP-N-acetylglucosamine--N-acetylmuramyl-(pentapeptide) pyrophosphoryl-undecaprenol N-acetylglucosamine transferase
MRAVLAGGGTGGHVMPALAIARELRAQFNAEIVFIGTRRGIETRLVPNAGFELRLIKVGALKQVSAATRLRTMFDLPRAIWRSGQILSEFRADVVIGVGGYASGPAMLAALALNVPTIAFAPDREPGFAIRVVAPFVTAGAVQFEQACRFFRSCRVTGVPVRARFFDLPARSPAERPTLLLFGGSQGAHALNQALLAALPLLRERLPEVYIIHQTGERDHDDAQARYLHEGTPAEVSSFIEDMPEAFARADLILCRAGASTVAELMAAGKPAILVPLPTAADDHQTRNAQALAEMGAAVLLPQSELAPERLVEVVTGLMRDRVLLAQMGARARGHAHPRAAAEIARLAARVAKNV